MKKTDKFPSVYRSESCASAASAPAIGVIRFVYVYFSHDNDYSFDITI